MPTPKRPSTARYSDKPCPICGKDQLIGTDGKTWCVHGGHKLEREHRVRTHRKGE